MDDEVGEILRRLEDEGLADNTVVIFIGDNGRCHLRGKCWLYDGGLKVPMIIRWPGKVAPGTVVDGLSSMVVSGCSRILRSDSRLPSQGL